MIFFGGGAALPSVDYLDGLLGADQLTKASVRPPDPRLTLKFRIRWRHVTRRKSMEGAVAILHYRAEFGITNAHRVFEQGLEHRLDVTWRAANDLQHLRRRGLLLQRFRKTSLRFGEFLGSSAQLLSQFGRAGGMGTRKAALVLTAPRLISLAARRNTPCHEGSAPGWAILSAQKRPLVETESRSQLQHVKFVDVAFGSLADIAARSGNVRFTPDSDTKRGHSNDCFVPLAVIATGISRPNLHDLSKTVGDFHHTRTLYYQRSSAAVSLR